MKVFLSILASVIAIPLGLIFIAALATIAASIGVPLGLLIFNAMRGWLF